MRERKRPVSEVSQQFGANVRLLMDTHSVSLDRLVDATGISKGNLQRVSTGQSEIPLSTAKALAEYWNRTIEELAYGRVKV